MKMHNFKKDIDYRLFYGLIIGMALLLTTIVYDACGFGPTCGPCAEYVFDGYTGGWRCAGCVIDCGPCYTCNTSTTPPSCKVKYDELTQECCDCRSICNWNDCKSCVGDGSGNCLPYCNPAQCQTCDGHGNCPVCGGREHEECCNGECYDTRTQQCCWDTGNGYICDINKVCCDGECLPLFCILGVSETETLLKLGWSNFNNGNWQDAISYFEKGLAKLPDENKPTNVLYGLARMYEKAGNKQKAEKIYWQLLSLMKEETSQIQEVQFRIISLEEKAGE